MDPSKRYILISIKNDQWLTSPLFNEIKEVIERHKSTVDFVEYHKYSDNSEWSNDNYIDYPSER